MDALTVADTGHVGGRPSLNSIQKTDSTCFDIGQSLAKKWIARDITFKLEGNLLTKVYSWMTLLETLAAAGRVMNIPDLAHAATALVQTPQGHAFDHLSSADFVGRWSLGSMGLKPVAASVFKGHSLFDGSEAFVEIRPFPELGLIDFSVGSAEFRSPRIFIRVTSGAALGHGDDCCLVSLHAMRATHSSDEAWARTCVTHEAEILLIKAQLESMRAQGAS